ncbi:MAG: hypothetical protein L0Y60_15570 [Beijerinckiaceae bacterium]|nr:hypothetical protein [Beijerinckiaceae bacterium]
MPGYRKRRDQKAVRAWRAVTGWVAAIVFAFALLDPVLETPAGAWQYEGGSAATEMLASGGQTVKDLLSQALACHMYFEHHQLVRAENSFAAPALSSAPACYLTRVIPLASLEPYPLRRPPRA